MFCSNLLKSEGEQDVGVSRSLRSSSSHTFLLFSLYPPDVLGHSLLHTLPDCLTWPSTPVLASLICSAVTWTSRPTSSPAAHSPSATHWTLLCFLCSSPGEVSLLSLFFSSKGQWEPGGGFRLCCLWVDGRVFLWWALSWGQTCSAGSWWNRLQVQGCPSDKKYTEIY